MNINDLTSSAEIDTEPISVSVPVDYTDLTPTESQPAVDHGDQSSHITDAPTEPPANAPEAAEAPASGRRKRGTNPRRDPIWTRHHAISTMGVISDVKLGGYELAREITDPLKQYPGLKEVPDILLEVCPWILNVNYLNFEGSADLAKLGLETCFKRWAANRVYYFHRLGSRSEHPAHRVNLELVYREFYDTFHQDVVARLPISEERARAFWLSVADRVPFQTPMREEAA